MAIINKEKFDAVQQELKKREKETLDDQKSAYINSHAFSSLIECGECGAKYRRHCQWSVDHSKKVPIWVCTKHQKHHDQCSAKPVKEICLQQGFMETLQILTSQRSDVIEKVKTNINTVINKPDTLTIEEMLKSLEDKQKELVRLNKETSQLADEEKPTRLIEEIVELQYKIELARKNTDNISIIEYRLKEIEKVLNGVYTEFNKDICRSLLEKIIIHSKHQATFVFKCGIAYDQEI